MPRYQQTSAIHGLENLSSSDLARHVAEVLVYARKRGIIEIDVFEDAVEDVTLIGFKNRGSRVHVGVALPQTTLAPEYPEDAWDADTSEMYAH